MCQCGCERFFACFWALGSMNSNTDRVIVRCIIFMHFETWLGFLVKGHSFDWCRIEMFYVSFGINLNSHVLLAC